MPTPASCSAPGCAAAGLPPVRGTPISPRRLRPDCPRIGPMVRAVLGSLAPAAPPSALATAEEIAAVQAEVAALEAARPSHRRSAPLLRRPLDVCIATICGQADLLRPHHREPGPLRVLGDGDEGAARHLHRPVRQLAAGRLDPADRRVDAVRCRSRAARPAPENCRAPSCRRCRRRRARRPGRCPSAPMSTACAFCQPKRPV